jgi:hypothetical protein
MNRTHEVHGHRPRGRPCMRSLAILLAAALCASSAQAVSAPAEPAQSNPQSATRSLPRPLIKTEDRDVWTALDDGSIRHIQSGLICPPKFGQSILWWGALYPATKRGDDVSCDYGRGPFGQAQSKLSIFAIRMTPGATLDSEFERYRAEMHKAYPGGTNVGPAIEMKGEVPADFPELRSEEMDVVLGGRRYKTEVIVFLKSGWVIELRATYRTEIDASDPGAAEGIASDLVAGSLALFQAVSTVGTTP